MQFPKLVLIMCVSSFLHLKCIEFPNCVLMLCVKFLLLDVFKPLSAVIVVVSLETGWRLGSVVPPKSEGTLQEIIFGHFSEQFWTLPKQKRHMARHVSKTQMDGYLLCVCHGNATRSLHPTPLCLWPNVPLFVFFRSKEILNTCFTSVPVGLLISSVIKSVCNHGGVPRCTKAVSVADRSAIYSTLFTLVHPEVWYRKSTITFLVTFNLSQ